MKGFNAIFRTWMIFVYFVPPDIWGCPQIEFLQFSDILQTNCKFHCLTIDKLIHNENNRGKNMLKHAPQKHKFDTRGRNSINEWGRWSMKGRKCWSGWDGHWRWCRVFSLPRSALVLCRSSWNEQARGAPASVSVMVFWFHFPISSLSHFDKVTSRRHLQYPTPFAQAHPNAIINMKYGARTEANTSVYRSEIKPGLRCQLLSVFSRAKKKKKKTYLLQGLLIPHLFVLRLQFGKTRLSQSLFRTRTTRLKEKCEKSLFCLTSLIHSNRLGVLELFGNNGYSQCKHPAVSIVEWRRTYRLGNLE